MNLPPQLSCPQHAGPLAVGEGRLECAAGCRYPIVRGIPRFVDSSRYASAFGRQWKAHPRTQLDSETGLPISRDRLTRCLGGALEVVRGKSVLEVGCGAGRFTEILLAAGARVTACDLSEAIEVNAANCGGATGYFALQADLLSLPVAPASFDVVLALGVLQHTPDPEQAIAALADCVAPGGALVLDHYTVLPRDTWYFRALTEIHPRHVLRRLILRLPPPADTRAADALAAALLPLHRMLWRPAPWIRPLRRLLRRVSPLSDYYERFPGLGVPRLVEWARLDTHDALTDRYKHLRNPRQIRAALSAAGLTDIEVAYGGNGVEARARRPLADPRPVPPRPRLRGNGRGSGLRVIVSARLSDAKLASKVEPLLHLEGVGEVVVVRRRPLPLSGVRNVCPPAPWRDASWSAEPWRLASVLREAARDPDRTLLVSFFLMPHAIHVETARRLLRVPSVPVLLGDEDVVRAETSPYFWNALEAAHAVGVRGPRSAARLAAAGLPPEKLFWPPNVYDPVPFAAGPAVERDIDAVFVGQFYVSKRLDVLLAAAAQVKARRGHLRLVLIGDGRDRASVEDDVRRLGLTADVTLTGTLSPPEIAGWLRRARLFVMTSEQEGLPMAMIEAMSCGLPVVIGDIGDVTMVACHGENAWIVGERTPAAFAEAITTLLADDERRQRLAAGAAAAARRFEAGSSLEAAQAAWRPVIERLKR